MKQPRPTAMRVKSLPARKIPMLLLQAREAFLQPFRPIFQRFDLTEQQWRILRVLNDAESMEQHAIARACQLSGPSLSNILAGLEEAGIVSRRRDRSDQRMVAVALTPAGVRLIETVAPHIDRTYRAVETMIGAELMASLISVLDRVIDLPLASCGGPNAERGRAALKPRARSRTPAYVKKTALPKVARKRGEQRV